MSDSKLTPWQRVFQKFGMNQSRFAEILGRHRSKISRELSDPEGLIDGQDQRLLMAAAKAAGVTLKPTDLLP